MIALLGHPLMVDDLAGLNHMDLLFDYGADGIAFDTLMLEVTDDELGSA